jgi:hypothetical protein
VFSLSLKSKKISQLVRWLYLGLTTNDYGSTFRWIDEKVITPMVAFAQDSSYFAPSEKNLCKILESII